MFSKLRLAVVFAGVLLLTVVSVAAAEGPGKGKGQESAPVIVEDTVEEEKQADKGKPDKKGKPEKPDNGDGHGGSLDGNPGNDCQGRSCVPLEELAPPANGCNSNGRSDEMNPHCNSENDPPPPECEDGECGEDPPPPPECEDEGCGDDPPDSDDPPPPDGDDPPGEDNSTDQCFGVCEDSVIDFTPVITTSESAVNIALGGNEIEGCEINIYPISTIRASIDETSVSIYPIHVPWQALDEQPGVIGDEVEVVEASLAGFPFLETVALAGLLFAGAHYVPRGRGFVRRFVAEANANGNAWMEENHPEWKKFSS